MAEPVVSVQNLRKEFGKSCAVDDISFDIPRGQVLGLLGPNGAGKSTTIQILLGLIAPTSGKALLFGLDPWKDRVAVLQRANFSSAYVSLPHNLKVAENLEIFARLYGVKDRAQKIQSLLALFEIEHLAKKMTGGLSSGESTRVNLCKAMLNDPDLLLLDEPTASLDPDIADKVRNLLLTYQKERGVTIVYTSHNMKDVHELCERVIFLSEGKIIADGSPSVILDHFDEASLEEVFIAIARDKVKSRKEEGESTSDSAL
ncbi:MAG: ABC transporter ATP-binding protein [Cyanobacteria bacterium SZAS TMP-1]|nr:ABC transporter ATP-binding protein [Cyanobacteria bacterium SZAS TMP-1]